MRKIFFLFLATLVFFLIELLIFNLFGRWFRPNLILLLIVYFTLLWGVRYGLLISVIGGLLKDSFSADIFGVYMIAFVVCAYIITVINTYFHDSESAPVRIFIVASISFFNLLATYSFTSMETPVGFVEFSYAFRCIMLPEVLSTGLVAVFVFKRLRLCVLRLSV